MVAFLHGPFITDGPENTRMKVTPPDVLYGSGSDLTLSCSSESSPPAQFQWALNGTLLSNKGPELRLENIQASQSGSYSCWAHNTRTLRYQTPEPSDITVLEPISGATITTSPNPPIIEGNSVTLTCDASGSIISREWMKDGQLLSAGGNMIISEDKRVLSINPVKRTDSGEYLCRVSNPISTADAKHDLIVNYGPDGMEIKGPTEIEVGQKFTLTCSADSIPTASYTWMHNGTKIPGHSLELIKGKSEYFDSGDYTCTATNDVTVNNTYVVHKLSVKGKVCRSFEDNMNIGVFVVL
ncbi:carcinoembryonic antigen-related cell adhesion molecule 5-like [Coregonus clupeaformis]|uniref:carcinoembryonic antigen-related cell adhesion molecule 5-like n=1 Tax=Coregonus clupeaformis TaxID=59861 RepID=UPI001E1C28CC|nr:carcinoembryonic antigen-related cell adhesion molecule 5-like [Coregonus clupeaformis]